MRLSRVVRRPGNTPIRRIGALRGGLWLAAICAAIAAIVVVALPASGASTSNPKTALLDGESVTTDDGVLNGKGEGISLEQYAAEQDGFTVTVVNGAEWEKMTAEEFAKYQLLIVGDPICSYTAESAIRSAATWAPVVMGASGLNPIVGNRAVVGTDPEYHYDYGAGHAQPTNPAEPTTAGAEHLEQDAIAYAGGVSGATGVYFDTSCADPDPTPEGTKEPATGGDLYVLDRLTTRPAEEWQESSDVPCGGDVQQIAENPVFDSGPTTLTDENIQGWSCSDHVAFTHFPSDWDALAVDTEPEVPHPTCGIDPDTHEEACGEAYVLVAGVGIVVAAPNLNLEPRTHTDPAGGSHTVTATVTKEGKSITGAVITFSVSGQNAGASGTCTTSGGEADPTCATDGTGAVEFTYSDAKGAGTDTIGASVTLEEKTQHATVSEEWMPEPTPTETTPTTTTPTTTTTTETTPTTPTTTTTTETTPTSSTPTTTTPTTTSTSAAKAAVLAFGEAHLAASRACVARSSYLASVSGNDVASVTFSVNGHKLKTLTKANSRGSFTLPIAVKAGKVEHLSILVSFTTATSDRSETITKTLARCAVAHPVKAPRFTG